MTYFLLVLLLVFAPALIALIDLVTVIWAESLHIQPEYSEEEVIVPMSPELGDWAPLMHKPKEAARKKELKFGVAFTGSPPSMDEWWYPWGYISTLDMEAAAGQLEEEYEEPASRRKYGFNAYNGPKHHHKGRFSQGKALRKGTWRKRGYTG